MTKSRGWELSCAFDAIFQFVEIKSIEKAWLLVFWWQSPPWLSNSSYGQSQRLCAEDFLRRYASCVGNHEGFVLKIAWWVFGLRRVFGTKPFDAVPFPGCSLLVVNKNGGGNLMLTKCWTNWRAMRLVGRQHVDQAPNLLQCKAPTWRPSAEPTQCQAPDRTPRVLQDECLIGRQGCHDS